MNTLKHRYQRLAAYYRKKADKERAEACEYVARISELGITLTLLANVLLCIELRCIDEETRSDMSRAWCDVLNLAKREIILAMIDWSHS